MKGPGCHERNIVVELRRGSLRKLMKWEVATFLEFFTKALRALKDL